jgi:gas vesicle protein
MGLGDKFKNLAKQAQDAVVEHKDQIHETVERVSVAADQKTHGKYTDKIAKFGQKAGGAVDRVADRGSEESDAAEHESDAAEHESDAADTPGAADTTAEQSAPQASTQTGAPPPRFDDEPA